MSEAAVLKQDPQTVTDEAAAAAAATTAAPEVLAAAAAAAVGVETSTGASVTGRVSILSEEDAQGKRRFFPRVKHLISNKEWEDFLTQVLQCIEEAGAPDAAAASHKANNPWYKAFDLIYGGVAREYSIPTGKNRYHKFKDKVLEVWVALEGQDPGINHCRELAMEQYERYKSACIEANKNAGSANGSTPNKAAKLGALSSPAASKLAGGKRSYSIAMGGGASVSQATSTLWKNLDEKAILDNLPAKLHNLVHLKQMAKEMVVGTGNRTARKSLEEHGKNIDGAFLVELTKYLEEEGDVDMATEGETTTTTSNNNNDSYGKALEVAFLYRYSSTLQEQKLLSEAYIKYTSACVTFPKHPAEGVDSTSTIAEGDELAVAAPVAAAVAAAVVAEGAEAAAVAAVEETAASFVGEV